MKHAYLIMAHNEVEVLKLLLKRLDNRDNVIYLHFDKKYHCDRNELSGCLKESDIHFIKPMNVQWGKYSQIKCELELLKTATRDGCDYYHLLTGVDLPLKPIEEINAFFEENCGREFISYDDRANSTQSFKYRVDKWYFKMNLPPQRNFSYWVKRLCNIPLSVAEGIANRFFGNRSARYPSMTFMKGSAYFDITHPLALYIVEREGEIKKIFSHTACCDEVFVQTYAFNSEFCENVTGYGTRYIDWSDPLANSPKLLTEKHYGEIMESGMLFARKFSYSQSKKLIEMLNI